MGCGSSSPAHPPGGAATANNNDDPSRRRPPPPQSSSSNHQNGGNGRSGSTINAIVDGQLERARAEDDGKIKMLLLGAGESGKSTIFKQMRLLYNTADRSDDDLRMYGVIARSNVVVAMRKLCAHLRNLGLEEELDRESGGGGDDDLDDGDHGSMTVRQAYDELMAYLVDNTANNNAGSGSGSGSGSKAGSNAGSSLSATTSHKDLIATDNNNNNDDINHTISKGGKKDWVGQSPRAGLAANNDAKQFLAHHESIKILWQASVVFFCWSCIYAHDCCVLL
jgi:hypothetical protein